jgi:hypothetical protein
MTQGVCELVTLDVHAPIVRGSWTMTSFGGGFNRSMQHTNHRIDGRSVADEAATQDLLLGQPESVDVGTLEAGLDAA